MNIEYLWIFISIMFRVLAAICAKKAGLLTAGGEIYEILINPWYIAELLFLFCQAISWVMVLRKFTLSFAYPFMSTTIILNLITAHVLFKESVHLNHFIGAIIIALGVIKLSRTKLKKDVDLF